MTPKEQEFIELAPTPQDLIKVAIKDLERVEKGDAYFVDMHTWHSGNDLKAGACHVCLAGACISRLVPASLYTNPSRFKTAIRSRLEALNCFRMDGVMTGLKWLECYNENIPLPKSDPVQYSDDPKLFKLQMLKLAKDLAKLKLKIGNM